VSSFRVLNQAASPHALAGDAATWILEPFLHVDPDRIYNPLTDRSLVAGAPGYAELRQMTADDAFRLASGDTLSQLAADGWLVAPAGNLAERYYLKYVALEATIACNQACFFCPVSISPREDYAMPMDFYEAIARQLSDYRSTLQGVSMIQYNEPTLDRLFLDRIQVLRQHGLPPAVLTNGTGLTPKRADAIMAMGGLHFLSINLSTLDAERYARERGGDHLALVLRNLDHLRHLQMAPEMVIAVIGKGDDEHRRDHEEITARFKGSPFRVAYYEAMDRAGYLPTGLQPSGSTDRLCGCEQTGSRPLQWLHITPRGTCVLCCQDYSDQYVVGNLHEQSLQDVLTGPEMAKMRRWAYGLDDAPADFICRRCIYARTPQP
jgi:MoaA/NifB/PqqE/SkfB family radical SAM enzyme